MSNGRMRLPMLPLSSIGVKLLDCEHRTPKPSPKGFPYIAIPDIKNGHIDLEKVRLISKEDYESWTRKTKPQAGDIILTRRGRVGDTAVVPKGLECAIGQDLVILRSDETRVLQRFLRWALRGPLYEREVQKYLNVGAVFDSLNCSDVPKFEIPVPSIPEQSAISDVLDALDSKIELNQQMNKTLEAIGQAIFRRWFVVFEFPDERGKPYKSSRGKMMPSEMGETPDGWRSSTVGREVQTVLGGTPSRAKKEYWENGDIPWIDSGKVNEFRIIEPSEHITKEGLENSATKLLPKRTTVLAITGATLGQVSLLEIEACANQSVVGVVESEGIPSEYIYFWVKHVISDIVSWATGGAQQHINKENINNTPMLIPNPKVLSAYANTTKPIFDKIKLNCFENLSLIRIRDALLPKLMTGKIRVAVSREDKSVVA